MRGIMGGIVVVMSVGFSIAAVDGEDGFVRSFQVNTADWSSVGANDYFVLQPGYQLTLRGREGGEAAILVITVLQETKVVDGVVTRIVEERETVNGELAEVSRNYYALDKETKDIYYFGEDVDMYEHGRVKGHGGSWLSGVAGARYGLFMPGRPQPKMRYYQEVAPGVALDRAEVLSLTEIFETPAGKFTACLKAEESSGLEKGRECKYYAKDIGLIYDAGLKLTAYGRTK